MGSIYRLERGLGEVAFMWHQHRCHKRDTWVKEKIHIKVNINVFGERDGSRFSHTCVRNLGERKGEQVCKSCNRL